jgi:Protein of unknown function (DUF4054)
MTAATFKAFLPAFAAVDPATIEYWITRFTQQFDQARFETEVEDATGYWVAYKLVLHKVPDVPTSATAAAGAVKRKRVGQVEVEYADAAVTAAIENPLLSNEWGREFDKLLRRAGFGAVAV